LNYPKSFLSIIVMCLSFGANVAESGAVEDADAIVTRAYQDGRIDDQISTLTFTFSAPETGDQQQVIYTMVWKNQHGIGDYASKAMFFVESPADRKGVAYLGWLVPIGSSERDDEWIYLPELRSTRRIAHRNHGQAKNDDEFGKSLLTRKQLDPRPPGLDNHRLLGEKPMAGRVHYIIANTPKQGHGKGRSIHWIDKETFRINRTQYFDAQDQEMLDIRFEWAHVGDHWLWKTVTALNPANQAKTVLDIDSKSVNTGLRDREFSKRILERGSSRFR